MSRRLPKLWPSAVSAVLATLFLVLAVVSTAYADTKPYFRTLNGGAFAGGWFEPSCEGSDDYQSPFTQSPEDYYEGAIMAWSNLATPRGTGASSNLDAFATGLIEGKGSPEFYGFYTGISGNNPLSFANVDPGVPNFWGGVFEGGLSYGHCIPDYFGTRPSTLPPWPGNFASAGDGQYIWNGGTLSGDIPAGRQIVLYSSGNVRITNNIQYQGGYNMDDVTKFVLVVQGDIFFEPGVSRLDGWYIAQPSNATNGVIWTCSNGNVPLAATFVRSSCNSTLDINGALTAKQVNLTRILGNLSGPSAENMNFTPEMILGGPFLEDETPGTAGSIQSLISLPPVF